MNGLRRDLIERRLWIVAVALVLAVVAVPFVLPKLTGHGEATADVASPPTGSWGGTSTTGTTGGTGTAQPASNHAKVSAKAAAALRHAETTRNPFVVAGGSSTTSTTATTSSTSSASEAGTTSTSTSTSGSGGSTSTISSGGSATIATAPSSTGASTTTVTVTTTSTTPTTSTSTTSSTTPTLIGDGPWSVYSVDVTVGVTGHLATFSNLARLTPLPSVATPKVMFTGVLDQGAQAVFTLGAGVVASGQEWCRPTRAQCLAIAVSPGQSALLRWTASDGRTVHETLRVSAITSETVTSRREALAALERVSQAGRCEVILGDPLLYAASRSDVNTVAQAACRNTAQAVPFPGTASGS